ncbi:TRAP transporter small permease subunit [Sneathiella litorea]|uniref:TRAP transporter small permease protein n=1 Tax=Sneathiella litorea TaxID=2606216 RepID=A0A6L8WA79_9PROT|nr:TRAP transporter small permease subunit [Sneathiella litorea]
MLGKQLPQISGQIVNWTALKVRWLTVAIVLLGVTNVFLRYGLSLSYAWIQDLVVYFHVAVFMVGGAYISIKDGHVRINIFYSNFSNKVKKYINSITYIVIVAPFFIYLHYAAYNYVINSWKILEASSSYGGLDAIFILKTFIWIFSYLMVFASIYVAFGNATSEEAPHTNEEHI